MSYGMTNRQAQSDKSSPEIFVYIEKKVYL